MKTYLIVTNDEFEHPVIEVVGSKKAADFFDIKQNTLSRYMVYGFPKKYNYKAVVIEELQYKTEEEKKARRNWSCKK